MEGITGFRSKRNDFPSGSKAKAFLDRRRDRISRRRDHLRITGYDFLLVPVEGDGVGLLVIGRDRNFGDPDAVFFAVDGSALGIEVIVSVFGVSDIRRYAFSLELLSGSRKADRDIGFTSIGIGEG